MNTLHGMYNIKLTDIFVRPNRKSLLRSGLPQQEITCITYQCHTHGGV
jgi:hypothetical protein